MELHFNWSVLYTVCAVARSVQPVNYSISTSTSHNHVCVYRWLPLSGSHSPPLGRRCLWLHPRVSSGDVPFLSSKTKPCCSADTEYVVVTAFHLSHVWNQVWLAFISRIEWRLKHKHNLWGERRGGCVCGEDQSSWVVLFSQAFECLFSRHRRFNSCIPCPVWWRETPPLGCRSPDPCRPEARSPSCHSRTRLPEGRSDCL